MNPTSVTAHGAGVTVELPLGAAASTFNLEKAVCSHGLFMMAPNQWDPQNKTLQRPLRLSTDPLHDDHESALMVSISQPGGESPHSLHVRVFGTDSLSGQHREALLLQVRRMLRLSDEENNRISEFQEMHKEAKERGFGRVFRSPTLFEDMIKCILLCNCQWSRTLSMAQALCELQLELQQNFACSSSANISEKTVSKCPISDNEHFTPKTPAAKESRKRFRLNKCTIDLADRFMEVKPAEENPDKEASPIKLADCVAETDEPSSILILSTEKEGFIDEHKSSSFPDLLKFDSSSLVGNFPSPRELAKLNEKFLAKRCNLGYRAGRILNLACEIVEQRIQLSELGDACTVISMSNYDCLFQKLKAINGFGPFTCANVLMCMGFYHVIPTDSETIRHLEQVHGKTSKIRTVQKDVEVIYEKFAPYQFLAYWSEVWDFYDQWFGKLSEMHHSSYKLITAANMKPKENEKNKRIKLSVSELHCNLNE